MAEPTGSGGAAAESHYRKLERLYVGAPNNEYYRPSIRIERERAEISIDARPELFHAAHAVHGSVYFKLLDDAAFFAANSVVPDVFVLTASFHIVLTRPVAEGRITAAGRLLNASRRVLVAESELRSEAGKLLAHGSGTYMRSEIPLGPDVGYV
ncbi:MAG: PaaI family thioesterase [Gemmatimonadota bacterium]